MAGRRALALLRAEGRDPAHGGEADEKQRASRRRRAAEEAAWEGDFSVYPDEKSRREILPGLQGLSLNRMAAATGLSLGYLSFVRRGRYVPHPRWWAALASVVPPSAG